MADDSFAQAEEGTKNDPKTTKYIQELVAEKHSLNIETHSHACRMLQDEINRVVSSGYGRPEQRFVDVLNEKTTKVVTKVIVPVKEVPWFNFVGKLLGPKGNTLKRLQEETQCRMLVLGRGSMKDKTKENDLRSSLDPKYSHLSDELHVEISALAPPAEAYARIAYALAEIRKYLFPDNNDDIAVQQAMEMENVDDVMLGMDNGEGADRISAGPPLRARGRGGVRGGLRGVGRGFVPTATPYRGRGIGLRGRGRGGLPTPAGHLGKSFSSGYGAGDGNGASSTQPQPFEDPARGRWKQRGGSRFLERTVPYTRRT